MNPKSLGNLYQKDSYWPTRVQPKLELIEGWARNGLSNDQIAANLGVGESTFSDYLRKYPELGDALRRGRHDAEIVVENALFKKACGYSYVEATKERKKVLDEMGEWNGKYAMVTTKKVKKHVEPDVNAQKYWLEHRAPKRWERNPVPGIDTAAVQHQLNTLAELLRNPVAVREIGSEEEE